MDSIVAIEIFFMVLVVLAGLAMAAVAAVVVGGLFKGQR